MADPLAGTTTYIVYCRGHGIVGQFTDTADANTAANDHFLAQHMGHHQDETNTDNIVAADAELYIGTVQRCIPDDVSSSSSSA